MKLVRGWMVAVLLGGLAVAAGRAGWGAGGGGKSLFEQRCAGCHGKDGQAQTGAGKALHVKPWRSDERLHKMTDEQIRQAISEGVTENGKRRMPPNRTLKPEQLDELVREVHRLSK